MDRSFWLTLGIVGAVILLLVVWVVSVNNMAINYEEGINTATSDIQVQEKRRLDLITKLVQVVEENTEYEQSTLVMVTQMRSAVEGGDIQEAQLAIAAIAEAYPTLQANASFTQLMTELSLTENIIAEARKTYNSNVKAYKRFSRMFPNNLFLGMAGHEVYNFQYLSYDDTELPTDLFPSQ